jgi:hypothetical protein
MSEARKSFKYNMSFYYQSTIVYFIVLLVYVVIRGSFGEGSFTIVTEDAIMYLLALIVLISLISLLYNLYLRKYIEIRDEGISFINRFTTKNIPIENIEFIRIRRRKTKYKRNAFRVIAIKLKNRRRRILIRPYDYENENELIKRLEEINEKLKLRNV